MTRQEHVTEIRQQRCSHNKITTFNTGEDETNKIMTTMMRNTRIIEQNSFSQKRVQEKFNYNEESSARIIPKKELLSQREQEITRGIPKNNTRMVYSRSIFPEQVSPPNAF